jgi:predicted ArsR family transcriptional regulator
MLRVPGYVDHVSTTERNEGSGRFSRRQLRDPVDLYMEVRAVALEWAEAQPEPVDPRWVSQREWNRVKQASVQFEHLPNANEVCRQLGTRGTPLPWDLVLEIAFNDEQDTEMVHRALAATAMDDTIGDERVFFSMRRIALELGKTWLSSLDYRDGYELLVSKDRRRHAGGTLQEQLLTFSQIYEYVEFDWSRACEIAELDTPPPLRGVPVVDALLRLYRTTGSWGSYDTLQRFARDHGFAVSTRPAKPWIEVVEEARDVVRRDDEIEPPAYKPYQPPTWDKPAEPMLEPGDLPAQIRRRYVDAEILLSVIRFLEQLGPGERPTGPRYETFARATGAPSLSTLANRGFMDLIAKAKKRGAKQQAERELEEIRNPTPEQRARQEKERFEELATDPRAQQLLDAIRALGGATTDELLAHFKGRDNSSLGSLSAIHVWLRPLRDTGRVSVVRTEKAFELRYMIAGTEPPPPGVDDPEAVRKATTKTCRKIHALLVADGPADSKTLAAKIGSDPTMLGKRLTRLVNAGFVTSEMTTTPGRQGRSFVYTATAKPMPEPEEKWTESRQRVYSAVLELGESEPEAIAARVGMTVNTTRPHLYKLVSAGYLERHEGSRPGGRGRYAVYRATAKQPPPLVEQFITKR